MFESQEPEEVGSAHRIFGGHLCCGYVCAGDPGGKPAKDSNDGAEPGTFCVIPLRRCNPRDAGDSTFGDPEFESLQSFFSFRRKVKQNAVHFFIIFRAAKRA